MVPIRLGEQNAYIGVHLFRIRNITIYFFGRMLYFLALININEVFIQIDNFEQLFMFPFIYHQ